MAEFNKKQQYQRWILPAQPSPLYPLAYNFVLVNSIDELKTILKTPFTEISFDTETTGLDLDEAFLVGYSFCFDGKTAYYVPVDHAEYEVLSEITKEEYILLKEQGQTNIKESEKKYYIINQVIKPGLGSEAVFLFYKRILLCKNVFMFNARFDIKVFEKYGFVQNNVPYETSRELKKKLGYLAYLVEGAKEFFNMTKLYELSYTIDDETYHGLYSFLIISNANRIAGINNFYNDVKLDDGKFEVLFCNLSRKQDVLKTLYYLRTSDITKVPGFYFHKTDNLKISFKKH